MDWIRRWVRRNTRPVPRRTARLYNSRLSFTYYILAWTAGGVAFYKLLFHNPFPEELDVYADRNVAIKPNIYKAVESIRKPSDFEVRIYNFRNFSFKSVEKYESKAAEEKLKVTQTREEDFFGGTEESPNEEQLDFENVHFEERC